MNDEPQRGETQYCLWQSDLLHNVNAIIWKDQYTTEQKLWAIKGVLMCMGPSHSDKLLPIEKDLTSPIMEGFEDGR